MRTLHWVLAIVGALTVALRGETVLFVGNSFTIGETQSVPTIFDRLAQAGGHGDPTTIMRAVGGTDFQYHATTAATLDVIKSQPWDFIILQNYSTEPTHFVDGTHSIADHYAFGGMLYDQILTNHPNTKIILFETWSRAAAHSYITGVSGPQSFSSTGEMQLELRNNYAGLANSLNANHPGNPLVRVAPIGTAWQNAGGLRAASDPQFVDLHGGDNYHGDDDGYYLSAAVVYSMVYGKSPVGLSTNPLVSSLGLNRNVSAPYLEGVAWSTVQAVPEPSAGLFAVLGSGLLAARRRNAGRG